MGNHLNRKRHFCYKRRKLQQNENHFVADDNQNSSQSNDADLQIVINKNKQLFDTLKSSKGTLRAGCLLMIFLMMLFIGFTILSLVIKEKIPYKSVMANSYGAFEMRNEKSDIFYFLFNTAELWCNTGIEVHKGERLIISASGIFNTEISHMHDKDSTIYWIQADGRPADKGPKKDRDNILSNNETFICNDADPGCLLATVIQDKALIDKWQSYEIDYDKFIKKDTPIKIVNKGTDYEVPNDGLLFFTVNDVVFTNGNIDKINRLSKQQKDIDTLISKIRIIKQFLKSKKKNERERRIGLERMWYNDNLGSFLIVIERPKIQ